MFTLNSFNKYPEIDTRYSSGAFTISIIVAAVWSNSNKITPIYYDFKRQQWLYATFDDDVDTSQFHGWLNLEIVGL